MKLKNLTIGKIKEICKSTPRKSACYKRKCPLSGHEWCCLGLRNMTKEELESEIKIKPNRKYIVYFKKYHISSSWLKYLDHSHFCFDDLYSKSILIPFRTQTTYVEEMIVKYRRSKRVIYQGNSYEEYLQAIKGKK